MVFCIDCHRHLTSDAVRLTATSAMCPDCYAEAMRAWQREKRRSRNTRSTFLPSPAELWQRIEREREAIAAQPRCDVQPTLRGTMLYEPRRK